MASKIASALWFTAFLSLTAHAATVAQNKPMQRYGHWRLAEGGQMCGMLTFNDDDSITFIELKGRNQSGLSINSPSFLPYSNVNKKLISLSISGRPVDLLSTRVEPDKSNNTTGLYFMFNRDGVYDLSGRPFKIDIAVDGKPIWDGTIDIDANGMTAFRQCSQ